MKRVTRICCGMVVTTFGFLPLGNSPVSATAQEERDRCCYTNSHGYQGVCEVTPEEGETCASILAYLNNPQSAGKNYCGNTKVRGGWKQVPCDEKSGEATERTCRMPQGPPS